MSNGDKLAKKKDAIASVIRDEIMAGRYPSGSMLPSESQLIGRFNVSRTPVRDAIAILKAEGLVTVHHGKGAVVRMRPEWVVRSHPRKIIDDAPPGSGSFDYYDPDLQGYPWDVVGESTTEWVRANAGLALVMGIREGADVYRHDQLLDDGQGRRMFHRMYLPSDTIRDPRKLGDRPYRSPTQLYNILSAAGYTLTWREHVRAVMPPPEDADRLHIPCATPMLVIQRIVAAPEGHTFATEEIRINAESAKLVYDLTCEN
ncbi:GntR family transcriptional regulator [Kibdelosporangium aridum]|uniref:GntR family transcriptional regulator n=1 Tax=Kibdelosporangium aridum TaxID=2030 RepID=A0A428YWX6_KIBAR|nr:GntR family transcriptional regulator [Kibdelosporangium aridum]RSM74730.1 GntR family transcriptional regulator [Kibdelosporangium aridum]